MKYYLAAGLAIIALGTFYSCQQKNVTDHNQWTEYLGGGDRNHYS